MKQKPFFKDDKVFTNVVKDKFLCEKENNFLPSDLIRTSRDIYWPFYLKN